MVQHLDVVPFELLGRSEMANGVLIIVEDSDLHG
jgi:hypothetical protein